jgi:DNA invertase Pin-like site-specific DNA recombinase
VSEREVVGYIRVSTKEQAESKLSLTHQEEKIRAYAVAQDLKLTRIFNDAAESAKDLNRTAVQELLAEVEKGRIEHIIILKLDRLIRNIENLGFLLRLFEKKGVTLSAVQESLNTSTAGGRLVVNMLGSIAEWERDTIAERTFAALGIKRAKGEKLGGIRPYGWAVKAVSGTKTLVPDPKEQKVRAGILSASAGGKGYQMIAEGLNAAGTKPRAGVRWYASTVRSIVLWEKKARKVVPTPRRA